MYPCRACPAEFAALFNGKDIAPHCKPESGGRPCPGGGKPPAHAELVLAELPSDPHVEINAERLRQDLAFVINSNSVDAALGLADDYIAHWMVGIIQGLQATMRATESRRTGG